MSLLVCPKCKKSWWQRLLARHEYYDESEYCKWCGSALVPAGLTGKTGVDCLKCGTHYEYKQKHCTKCGTRLPKPPYRWGRENWD